ncbi:MAG: bifunctional phosphopantothenoylcysteine decarboxylase/phosphopantothenate--cysteine ligase CoaBC [Acidobacteria bacterium]|nr:bifunctional phosphopantothenoylcysteine decarboxylase/phosphopantothenate--cysteine ligase CoaBC [Acidobacteriota bacterium]
MNRQTGQRIVIGISGGIAAYKTVNVIRELQKRGYRDIETILTANGTRFVTPVTVGAITGKLPYTDTFEPGRALSHISLVQPCGILAVVPATADILAKFAGGIADDFLSTAYLACTGPVLVAPSMNSEMYRHPATERNIARLKKDGVHVLEPDAGYLACGSEGPGRMPDAETVADMIEFVLHRKTGGPLSGMRVIIASGGTAEPIDPVRTITNRSSGKMGKELATAFALAGADVEIVAGTGTACYPAYCRQTKVQTASEMKDAVLKKASAADIIVMAAAVADYTPETVFHEKKKKDGNLLNLRLKPTTDILKTLGTRFEGEKILVGFAAETSNVEESAKKKLTEKKADLIVGNIVGVPDSGFEADTIRAVLVAKDQSTVPYEKISKEELAFHIVEKISAIAGRNK